MFFFFLDFFIYISGRDSHNRDIVTTDYRYNNNNIGRIVYINVLTMKNNNHFDKNARKSYIFKILKKQMNFN